MRYWEKVIAEQVEVFLINSLWSGNDRFNRLYSDPTIKVVNVFIHYNLYCKSSKCSKFLSGSKLKMFPISMHLNKQEVYYKIYCSRKVYRRLMSHQIVGTIFANTTYLFLNDIEFALEPALNFPQVTKGRFGKLCHYGVLCIRILSRKSKNLVSDGLFVKHKFDIIKPDNIFSHALYKRFVCYDNYQVYYVLMYICIYLFVNWWLNRFIRRLSSFRDYRGLVVSENIVGKCVETERTYLRSESQSDIDLNKFIVQYFIFVEFQSLLSNMNGVLHLLPFLDHLLTDNFDILIFAVLFSVEKNPQIWHILENCRMKLQHCSLDC